MEPHLINENTLEENISLCFNDYSAGSEDEEAETFEESDEESDIFGELPEIELFKFNEENYINAQIALENEIVNQLSDENEDFEDQEILSVPSPSPLSSTTPVEEVNELSYILDPTIYKNFSPCVLIDYFNNKLQTCGQTTNVRNICQLVGTWQIDENAILNYQSKGIPLGVCMNHFNYNQKNHNAYCKQLRKPEQSEIRRRRCLFCFQNFHFFSRGLGSGSEDEEAETFEESDEESDIFGELPEIELFKFNEENYINAQIALENEIQVSIWIHNY
ncbi:hypothetical protein Glove_88g40 [Diversispora epigaea]|uniref:Uncharacterized protein n=1 Tax=Diversispora epigaea TaxID=1348612 RepID=A0A397J5Y7_9GLOM|nr:hypothetical protein Glove_88g40 [Diversispora epigaea]